MKGRIFHMQSHGSTLDSNYTKVCNYFLEREDLEFGAKGLLSFFLVRKGWHDFSIRTLSTSFGESQAKITKWMKALADLGYLIRRRVRSKTGKFRTYVHAFARPVEVPGGDMDVVTAEEWAALTSGHFPSLGEPNPDQASAPPSGVKTKRKTSPPTPQGASEPQTVVEMVPEGEGDEEDKSIIFEIGLREPRLELRPHQVAKLVPLVAALREKGATRREIIETCLQDLPLSIERRMGFLKYRLEQYVPQERSQTPLPPPVEEILNRLEPKKGLCPDCGYPMIKTCAHCEGIEPTQPDFLAQAARRGAARARELLFGKSRAA